MGAKNPSPSEGGGAVLNILPLMLVTDILKAEGVSFGREYTYTV